MASRALHVFRAGSLAARRAPAPLVGGLAQLAGGIGAVVAPGRRRQVERNLRRVHGPALTERALRRGVRKTFESYARYWAESFRLPGTSPAALDEGFTIDGWDHLTTALDAGKGAILGLPHLGGWEWAGFWVAEVKQVPLTVVVEQLEPPDVFEWFVELRRAFGMNVVPLGPHAGREVLRALGDNHVLCLLADRDIDGGGVDVEFFGERTTLPAGPATLALRTGAPLLPAAVYFTNGRRQGEVRPPVPTERAGRFRDDVARVTQLLAAELESLIRVAPEQWHLLQPNWPSDPGYRVRSRPRIARNGARSPAGESATRWPNCARWFGSEPQNRAQSE